MHKKGLRAEIDTRAETMQKKIRDAEISKIPYMAVIGDKEALGGTVSLRGRKEGNIGVMPIEAICEKLLQEIENRK